MIGLMTKTHADLQFAIEEAKERPKITDADHGWDTIGRIGSRRKLEAEEQSVFGREEQMEADQKIYEMTERQLDIVEKKLELK